MAVVSSARDDVFRSLSFLPLELVKCCLQWRSLAEVDRLPKVSKKMIG